MPQTIALKEELEHGRSILGALVDLHWEDSLYESLDPQSRYESTLNALKTLILAESLRQPVILQLEDVHWLDEDSLHFMQRLVHGIDQYPIAIIATARPEGVTLSVRLMPYHQLLDIGQSFSGRPGDAGNGYSGWAAWPSVVGFVERGAGGQSLLCRTDAALSARREICWKLSDEGWEPSEKASGNVASAGECAQLFSLPGSTV